MPPKFSWTPLVVIIAIVLIGAGAGSAYLYYHSRPSNPAAPRLVQVGDNVTVNYIGIYGSGPEAGKVFDTSVYAVGSNSAAWPKSIEYHARGLQASNYTPLAVHVGGNTPQSGYSLGNLSFIQVVTGFWQGLVGVLPNQTETVIVPPALGYGYTNPACVSVQPLTQYLPVVQTMPGVAFNAKYPGALAASGSEFRDSHYGWEVLVLSANSSYVTVENLAQVGDTAHPAGWNVEVTAVASTANGTGQITLVNQLTPSQAGLVVGSDFSGKGPCSSASGGKFIVTAVDPVHGTYTEDYNQEVVGKTLIFMVTVVNVFPGVPAA
ncbi:MAG: FKBP-type peptidyl-prolyl cis-trans isomerase [Thermoplasmata archaeon]|nr:FKBP-type peptidyl-prolyl cis-trans isomerase [Thermoplasmata archaeon]